MLNGNLALHDCRDVESLVWNVIARSKLELSDHDREDLAAFLVETCWELSLRYGPGAGSTTSFAGWATTNLRLRVVDWQRRRFGRTRWQFSGRTYERKQPQQISLDELGPDQLELAVSPRPGDPADDRDPVFEGLVETGDRQRARDLDLLGLEAPARAP